jgi:hypothetical protein
VKVNIDWIRGATDDVLAVTSPGSSWITACPREQLLEFVTVHGVSVNDVPLPSAVIIEDGQVTFEVVVRDEQGRVVVDEATNGLKRTTVTVPQCAPWPLTASLGQQPHLFGCVYPEGGLECSCVPKEAG